MVSLICLDQKNIFSWFYHRYSRRFIAKRRAGVRIFLEAVVVEEAVFEFGPVTEYIELGWAPSASPRTHF